MTVYQGDLAASQGVFRRFMVDLSATRVLCTFHPLPWKEVRNEPSTMVTVTKFTLELFNVLVNDEAFISRCDGNSELINKYMPIPLCCWVAVHYPEALKLAYKNAEVEPPNADDIAVLN